MSIPPRFLDDLRTRLTLSDVVGKKVKLTRAGREYKGCCPFHREKTPSFYVNDDKQFYHCFGCGAHGDVIGFTMAEGNLSFIEAIEQLAAQAGMQVPESRPEDIERAKVQKDLHAAMEEACRWMETQLYEAENADVLEYMVKRGFSEETLNNFRIGYAPDNDKAFKAHMLESGFSIQQLLDCALLKPSTRGGEPYGFFRDRVMFPVSDRRGRIVAFGGRILPEHIRPQTNPNFTPPKYLNSSDTPLFHKGRMLYGDSHAREAAREGHTPIVVEGYLDVMACHQAGLKGAVAPLGTALTEEQILLLWKMCPEDEKRPVLSFDGDNAGLRAASRACERVLPLLRPGHTVALAFLPEGEDPDTYIKARGKGAMVEILQNAQSLDEFLWNEATENRDFDTPDKQAALADYFDKLVTRITDKTVQTYYAKSFKDRMWREFRQKNSFKKWDGGREKTPAISLIRPRSDKRKSQIIDTFFVCLINHPWAILEMEDHLHSFYSGQDDRDGAIDDMLHWAHEREPSVPAEDENNLDRDVLKSHLLSLGHQALVDLCAQKIIYTHAGYAKTGTQSDKVRAGLKDLLKVMEQDNLTSELNSARRQLNENFSEDAENRLFEMRKLLGAGNNDSE